VLEYDPIEYVVLTIEFDVEYVEAAVTYAYIL
jgi:hypothetical protein